MTIFDSENQATNLEATTFGLESISGLGVVSSYVFLPLTPLDLYEFFGDESLTSGTTSEAGSEWSWSVGKEINDNEHGLVYPCLLYTSPSPRDGLLSRMPSSA